MKLQKVSNGVVVEVFVKPNSRLFQLRVEGDELVAFCRESPVRGRANKELIKELSKLFKRRVDIVSGFTSKQKRILIVDISTDDASAILSKYASQ
jgi:uncharacterized protein (TIGR00251 family)